MNRSKLGVLTLIIVLLSFYTIAVAAANPYDGGRVTNIAISSDGTFSANEPNIGVAYQIQGTPMSTGTVTANVYNGNPQPTASIPAGISLTRFVSITFNMTANEFSSAKIIISYSDSYVKGISAPYSVYKYNVDTNSYVALPSTVDNAAQTITVTVASIADPIFAIGGATVSSGEIPVSTWAIIAVAVIVIVVLVVFAFARIRTRVEK